MTTPNTHPRKELEDLQQDLAEVQELLRRHQLVENLVQRQNAAQGTTQDDASSRQALVETLVHRQNEVELRSRLDALHPADVATILEALPLEERLAVWELVKAERDGEILLEVSDAVRESLIRSMDPEELVAAAEQLDADEIADLAPDLPDDVMQDVYRALSVEEREQLRSAMSYPEDAVGSLMDFEVVSVRADVTLEVVTRYLRRLDELPGHTDQLFVVDREENFLGTLPLGRLIVSDLDRIVGDVLVRDTITLNPDDKAEDAANAFERYDLVSAPVVSEDGHLLGRVTVARVVDFIREKSEDEQLAKAGLREEEDVFAPVMSSVRNRAPWLLLNLFTASVAAWVASRFEATVSQVVMLAFLMSIIAGIGGNSGNQTMTLVIRALALGQISIANVRQLMLRELSTSALIGVGGGGIAALFAWWISSSWGLGAVMWAAMVCNLIVGATVGMLVPLARFRFGRDPAVGSSVLLTFVTDTLGFFIFLGLASLFLT